MTAYEVFVAVANYYNYEPEIVIQEINPCFPFHELAVNHYYAYPIFQFFIVTGVSWLFVAVCQNFKYSKYILG